MIHFIHKVQNKFCIYITVSLSLNLILIHHQSELSTYKEHTQFMELNKHNNSYISMVY